MTINVSVLGDSHSRLFSNSKSFTPFFLGPGSSFNLIEHGNRIEEKVDGVLSSISTNFDLNMLIFGEPTCRFQIEKNHYVYRKKNVPFGIINERILEKSFYTYKNIILTHKSKNVCVCAPISVYPQSMSFSIKLSEMLKQLCCDNNLPFIDPKQRILDDFGEFPEHLKSDPIHANQNILSYVKKEFAGIGFDVDVTLSEVKSFSDIKQQFSYNERFGCYVY